jgi:putative nucleotidyltransferase with HDIG domain
VSWLRRLFAGTRPRPRGASAATPERWAEALGIPLAAFDEVAPPLLPIEEATAQAVLDHFDANRPGPASFPSIALQILEQVRDPRIDAAGLGRTIELDAALSTGVLLLANSAVYRGVRQVESLREAVARLGLVEVARLATALSTRSLYRSVRAEFELFAPTWNRLFFHAATVARSGAELARTRELGEPDRVYLGGMLHDVGKSLALRSLAALQQEGRVPRHDGEAVDRILHQVHVEVGAEAHREWGLPAGLSAIAEWHHLPEIEAGPEQVELHLVRLTSAAELLRTAPGLSSSAPGEAVDSALALGLSPSQLQELRLTLAEQAGWVRALFGDALGGPATAR